MTSAVDTDLLHGASICCRSCGAPLSGLSDPTTLTCGHCGASMPLDGTGRARLSHYAAALSRAEHKARNILRQEMLARLLPALGFRMKVAMFGSMALLLVIVPILMLAGSGMVFGETPDAVKIAGGVLLLVDMVLAVVAFPVAIYLVYQMSARTMLDAARLAKSSSFAVAATLPATCGRCGGAARIVAIGTQPPLPCPWCAAALVASSVDSADLAVQALLDAQQTTTDERFRRAHIRAGMRDTSNKRRKLPGFHLSGGIYEAPDLPGAWVSLEYAGRRDFRRIEVDRPVSIPGRVFFVRREVVASHAAACAEVRLPLPPVAPDVDASLAQSFAVFADPEVVVSHVVAHAGIQDVLRSLEATDSLHLDPGGVSCWSIGLRRGLKMQAAVYGRTRTLEHALG